MKKPRRTPRPSMEEVRAFEREVGREGTEQIIEEEWRKREPKVRGLPGSDPIADVLWQLLEQSRKRGTEDSRRWRALYNKRLKLGK